MDLAKIDIVSVSEKGFTFKFILDGIETDLSIDVLGAASRTHKQAMQKIEAYKQQCYKRGKSPEDEVLEEKFIDLLAACTKGWKGLEEDGKAVAFSQDEAKRVYAAYPLLMKQVSEAIHNVEEQLNLK